MDGFLGEIRIFTGSFAPKDWAFCNGQEMTVNTPAATNLYKILGNRFGGNAHLQPPTLALPNMPDPFRDGHYIICINGLTLVPNE